MFLSDQISCHAVEHFMPGNCSPPQARSNATSLCLEQCQTDLPSSRAVRPSRDSCRGAVPALGSESSTSELGRSLGGGEWETTQDKVDGLGWRQADTFYCGVLGVAETALGSSIPSLAVSGPDSATEDDDHDDSFQQTRELFADWQPGVTRTPCSGFRCSPHPAQQQGSWQLYQCATQLRRWSLFTRRGGGVTAT